MLETLLLVGAVAACCAVPVLGALSVFVLGKRPFGSASETPPQEAEELPKL